MLGSECRRNLQSTVVIMLLLAAAWSATISFADEGDDNDSNPEASLFGIELTEAQEQTLKATGARGVTTWAVQGTADPTANNGPGDTNSVVISDIEHIGNGAIYVAGSYRGDSLLGGSNPTVRAERTAFFAKIDQFGMWGSVVTSSRDSSSFGGAHITGMEIDDNNDVWVCGWIYDSIDFGNETLMTGGGYFDGFVARYDTSATSWDMAANFGGSNHDIANDCAVTSAGDIYVAGTFWGTTILAGTQHNTQGGQDMFLVMVDNTGAISWAEAWGGNSNDNLTAVAIDNVDNGYVIGHYNDNPSSWPDNHIVTAGRPYASFVSKVNPAGSFQWTRDVPGASQGDAVYGHAVAFGNGNIYAGGHFSGQAQFRNGATVVTSITANNSATNAWIAELSTSGTWSWASKSSGDPLSYQSTRGIGIGPNGEVAISGVFSDNNEHWTNATFGQRYLGGAPKDEAFVAGLDTYGSWKWADRMGGEHHDVANAVIWVTAGRVTTGGVHCLGSTLGGCGSHFGAVNLSTLSYNEGAGFAWSFEIDTDNDSVSDLDDNCRLIPNTDQSDIDGDQIGDVCDDDMDGDGYDDYWDDCEGPAVNWVQSDWTLDRDGDGCRDSDEDDDDDGDGVDDVVDSCDDFSTKHNWSSTLATDYDTDGCHDIDEDDDDDSDGIVDDFDSCPRNPSNRSWTSSASSDYDTDGCQDSDEDADDDSDGIDDVLDNCQLGVLESPFWTSESVSDHDGDGCRDIDEDYDDDGDGVVDQVDSCELGATGWNSTPVLDLDGDGCRDYDEDDDDDGDGLLDDDDACPAGDVAWVSNQWTDVDGDGCRDAGAEDIDDDSDMVPDDGDNCPQGETGWISTPLNDVDRDGCRDETEDLDDDDDGVWDDNDLCAETPIGQPVNDDGCSDSQADDDGDGIINSEDNCQGIAAAEGFDINNDGCTDDTDQDDVLDNEDDCLETPSGEQVDARGCGYVTQQDADGDGVLDPADACLDTSSQEIRDQYPNFPFDDEFGCWVGDVDSAAVVVMSPGFEDYYDDDNIPAWMDLCPGTEQAAVIDQFGCSWKQQDDDDDGISNENDACIDTAEGSVIDEVGCSAAQRSALQGDGGGSGWLWTILALLAVFIAIGAGVAVIVVKRKQATADETLHQERMAKPTAAAGLAHVIALETEQAKEEVEDLGTDDPNYKVDESGCEWWMDDDGVWWYRTPEMDDWTEHPG